MLFPEFHLCGEAGSVLQKHRMTVTRYHLAFAKRFTNVFLDLLLCWAIGTDLLAKFKYPFDHFLVGKTVQRPASPFIPAAKLRYGSLGAEPTRCVVCAETLPLHGRHE